MLPSTWIQKNVTLPKSSVSPGQWKMFAAQRDIVNLTGRVGAPFEIYVLKSARVGATSAATGLTAYHAAFRASSCTLWEPTQDDARSYARESFRPLTRGDCAKLHDLLESETERTPVNTLAETHFLNGSIVRLRWAGSNNSFKRFGSQFVVLDEVDSWGLDIDAEGDPIRLALARQIEFGDDRKLLAVSTPSGPGGLLVSHIENRLPASAVFDYKFECSHCGHWQVPTVMIDDSNHGLSDQGYVCESCSSIVSERVYRKLSWRNHENEKLDLKNPPDRVALRLNCFANPKVKSSRIVDEYEQSKHDDRSLVTFNNLWLGQPKRASADETFSIDDLTYTEQPLEAGLKTTGVDVGKHELMKCDLVFAEDGSCDVINLEKRITDTSESPGAQDVEWTRGDTLTHVFVDAGYRPDFVRSLCDGQFVHASRGYGRNPKSQKIVRTQVSDEGDVMLYLVTNSLKHVIVDALESGRIRFADWLDDDDLEQIVSERWDEDRARWVKIKGKSNHYFDALCMAYAARIYAVDERGYSLAGTRSRPKRRRMSQAVAV